MKQQKLEDLLFKKVDKPGSSAFDLEKTIRDAEGIAAVMFPQQKVREYLTEVYHDYVNNYLTVEKFAEHNGITTEVAIDLLQLAEHVVNSKHPEA